MRFHVYDWNKRDQEYLMIVLTEEDIKNEINEHLGAGYEIVILPAKYEHVHTDYLDTVRYLAVMRNGKIIYI